jgi:hypothetical protein
LAVADVDVRPGADGLGEVAVGDNFGSGDVEHDALQDGLAERARRRRFGELDLDDDMRLDPSQPR